MDLDFLSFLSVSPKEGCQNRWPWRLVDADLDCLHRKVGE